MAELNEFDRNSVWVLFPPTLTEEQLTAARSALEFALGADTPVVPVATAHGDAGTRGWMDKVAGVVLPDLIKDAAGIVIKEMKDQMKENKEARDWYDNRSKDYLEKHDR